MLNANSFSQQAGFVREKKMRTSVKFPKLGGAFIKTSPAISDGLSNQSKENTAHLTEQTFDPV